MGQYFKKFKIATNLIVSSLFKKNVPYSQTGSSANLENLYVFCMIDFYSPGCLLSEYVG